MGFEPTNSVFKWLRTSRNLDRSTTATTTVHCKVECMKILIRNTGFLMNKPFCFVLIGIVGGGVQLGPLDTAATNRPIVPAPGDYDVGEIGGMIGRGNRSTRRKPAPVPLCPPQTPHAARTRTRTAAVGSQRLTAWATARPSRSACCSLRAGFLFGLFLYPEDGDDMFLRNIPWISTDYGVISEKI
jgi:hypothetical protein